MVINICDCDGQNSYGIPELRLVRLGGLEEKKVRVQSALSSFMWCCDEHKHSWNHDILDLQNMIHTVVA